MPSNVALMEEIDRSKRREKRAKEKVATKFEEVTGYAGTILGAGAAGYMDAKYPGKRVLSVGLPMAVGLAGIGVGIGEYAGKASHFVGGLGAGLVGAEFYKVVYDKTTKGGKVGGLVGAGPRGALPNAERVTSADEMRAQLARMMRTG